MLSRTLMLPPRASSVRATTKPAAVSSVQLATRRQTVARDDPELLKIWDTWQQRVVPHGETLIAALYESQPTAPRPPDFNALAEEFAREGAVCLRGLIAPHGMAEALEGVVALDDPYAVFWHPPDEDGRNTHLGAQLLIDSPQLTYDPQPLLDRLAPGLSMPTQLGWWIAALPSCDTVEPTQAEPPPPTRWHIDGFEDKSWHCSERVLITLVLAQDTPGPQNGATAFRAGSHRWVARFLVSQSLDYPSFDTKRV